MRAVTVYHCYGGSNGAAFGLAATFEAVLSPPFGLPPYRDKWMAEKPLKGNATMNAHIQGNDPARPKLLTSDTPIIILPTLAAEFGLLEAAFLQQLHYSSLQDKIGIRHSGHKWVYNTLDQWHDQLPCWSIASLERAITKLRKLGIIHIQQLSQHRSNRTNYYRIDYPKIAHLIDFAIPSNCDHDHLNLMDSTPQPDANHPIKMRSSIPSDCGLGYSKTSKENTKDPSKTKNAGFKNLNGTDQPTQPEPSPDDLTQIPPDQLTLWRQLRHARLDIAPTDTRLRYWLDRRMVKTITQTLLACTDQRWHTPEQLGLTDDRLGAAA